MEKKIIEYLGTAGSGCWDLHVGTEYITFHSVWGDGEITFPEKGKRTDAFSVEAIGTGVEIVKKALGKPEVCLVFDEDGIESSHMWFLTRESKTTESTDVLNAFAKELEKRNIVNSVESGYFSFKAGGEEIFRIVDGCQIKANGYELDLSRLAEELMLDYCNGEIGFYLNNNGIICE